MDIQDLTQSIWGELSQRETADPSMAPAEQLTFRERGQPYTCAMVSRDGSLHVLISPETPLEEPLAQTHVAGLHVRLLPDCLVTGRDRQTYIDVRCDSRQFGGPFTAVAKQIVHAVLRDGKPPSEAVNSVIRLWRRFWVKQPSGALSENEQLGLIAELATLEILVHSTIQDAVASWTGPLGAEHDFELPAAALEIKATLGNQRRHQINGLHQLAVPAGRSLMLISVLALRGEKGITLPEGVAKITDSLAKPSEQEVFLDRLAATGYTPAHDEEYASIRFVMGEPIAFLVDEGFPRITPESFLNPISPRIDAVRYTVDLEGLLGLPLDAEQFGRHVGSAADTQSP